MPLIFDQQLLQFEPPQFWNILGSKLFEVVIWFMHTYYLNAEYAKWLHLVMTVVYAYAMKRPIQPWLFQREYLRNWTRLILYNRHDNYIVTPLPTLLSFLFAFRFSYLLVLHYPFIRIWTTHRIIVERITTT
jgi:hypothetical protein